MFYKRIFFLIGTIDERGSIPKSLQYAQIVPFFSPIMYFGVLPLWQQMAALFCNKCFKTFSAGVGNPGAICKIHSIVNV